MKRELILLIPGLVRVSRGRQLSLFVEGMIAASERIPLTEVSGDSVPRGVKRLGGERDNEQVEFDIKEAYWNDMVPSLSQEPVNVRVQRGASLFFYWVFSSAWKRFLNRKYLTFGLCFSTIAFLLWYTSTLLLFLDVVMADQTLPFGEWFRGMINSFCDWFQQVINSQVEASLIANEAAQKSSFTWKFWMIMTMFTSVVPVSLLVDMSDFSKRYISNESASSGKPALRLEIIAQIREQLYEAIEKEKYDRVTIVGHSFGATVAVDLLSDLPSQYCPMRLITLGSLIEFLACRAEWFQNDVDHLVSRTDLEEWIDVNSCDDWFASGVGVEDANHFRAIEVKSFGTILDKIFARVHSRYFDNQDAVRAIVGLR